MGRHKKWRSIVKKERRRRIRIEKAKQRDPMFYLSKKEYELWLKQQEELEVLELESINYTNQKEHEKWIVAETYAQEQWQKAQEMKDVMRLIELEKEIKKKLEFEAEQARKLEEEKQMKELAEENKKKQELFMHHLEQFLLGKSRRPPSELSVIYENKPNHEKCPFFSKTGCCRFGDLCSRNHQSPSISKVLLAPNFFHHFGLNNFNHSEQDADLMLEYEDSDTYIEFKEFFYDILPEFERFGEIRQLKVCNNYERHLRGNTYVEYKDLRCAVSAYRALHARWYGGRQLALQFCNIPSWKTAICGTQARHKCPKGRSCNFLHIFRNPRNMFPLLNERDIERRKSSTVLRWSKSPDVELPNTSTRDRSVKDHNLDSSNPSERTRHGSREYNNKNRGRSKRSPSPRRSRRRKTPPTTGWRWSESPEIELHVKRNNTTDNSPKDDYQESTSSQSSRHRSRETTNINEVRSKRSPSPRKRHHKSKKKKSK